MPHGRFDNPVIAALAGFKDLFRKQPLQSNFDEAYRIDGKTCLVTGANSGLGYALAVGLARRGGKVIMAQRRFISETEIKARNDSHSDLVSGQFLDLSKINSIHDFVNRLKTEGAKPDIIILNAGVALPASRKTESGLEEMFLVNYLSNFILLNLLLANGLLSTSDTITRIIFISSDSHQGSSRIDFEEFGRYVDYGVTKGMNYYSYYKLVLNTLAIELDRRLKIANIPCMCNVICPGPVHSNIIKEAPWVLRIILGSIFSVIFKKPDEAAKPVIYMAVSPEFEHKRGEYLHMWYPKKMDNNVYLQEDARKLWEASAALWQSVDAAATVYF